MASMPSAVSGWRGRQAAMLDRSQRMMSLSTRIRPSPFPPSILITWGDVVGDYQWHGYLERGIWREI